MAIDYTLTVKKIHSLEKIYVLFSASTRMPFVECDPEEFDDQIYIFLPMKNWRRQLRKLMLRSRCQLV